MTIQPMQLILIFAFALIMFSFWRAHKTKGFDFNAFDLVMSRGKVDKIAVSYMLVLGVSTWVMIDLQIKSQMTEGYFLAYIGAWVTPLVSKMAFGKEPQKQEPQNVSGT